MFFTASKSLYLATRSRSEEVLRSVGRNLLSFPGEDVQPANDDVPPDASLGGIAVRLDRPLDDTTRQQILYAANTIASYSEQLEGNQSISDASSFLSDEYVLASESLTSLVSSAAEETPDVTTSIPTSLTIVQNFYGSIYSPNSHVSAPTMHVGGSGNSNSGSVVHTITPPSTT